MPDIELTNGADLFVQAPTPPLEWTNIRGLQGDDNIQLYLGTVMPGEGHDVIVRMPLGDQPWLRVEIAYWDSPQGFDADVPAGQIKDGWGTVDTLIGFQGVALHGSGHADRFKGGEYDDLFWGNGGHDFFDGGGGLDDFSIPGWRDPKTGEWRSVDLSELIYEVSADGKRVHLEDPTGRGEFFRVTLENVEILHGVLRGEIEDWKPWTRIYVEDLIRPADVASDVLAAEGAYRWNAGQPLGTAVELTFAFLNPGSLTGGAPEGFREYTQQEKVLIRTFLSQTSERLGLDFREISAADASRAQLKFGVSQQTDTKGFAFMPGQEGAGSRSGEIWMDVESLTDFRVGSEGFQAFIHELGHALGLRHLRNTDPGESWSLEAVPRFDALSLSVMSSELVSDGTFRKDWGPLDLAALSYLYGQRASVQSDTYLSFSESEFKSRFTVIDDGGFDTLDFRDSGVGVYVDLNPGGVSSVGLTPLGMAAQQNISISYSTWIESVVGTSFDDVLIGNELGNVFRPLTGNDWIDGQGGLDMVVLPKSTSSYALEFFYKSIVLASNDGISGFLNLENVEVLRFSDRTVSFETSAHDSYDDLPDSLYHFFIVAFGGAPGVTYMDQLAEAYRYWMLPGDKTSDDVVRQVVDVFITKTQFTGVYPLSLDNWTLAERLVDQIVRNSASESTKDQATQDIFDALSIGWSRGKVLYTVFGNLAEKPIDDPVWGATAKMFQNQIEIAKYYTDVMGYATTDLDNLRGAISKVTGLESLETDEEKFALILAGLLNAEGDEANNSMTLAASVYVDIHDPHATNLPPQMSIDDQPWDEWIERFYSLV